jgi:hypothetical protein
MIQRVQSIFLFVAAVLSSLLLTGTLMQMKDIFGNLYTLDFLSLTANLEGKLQVQKLLPLTLIIMAVPLTCLISIFFYKNRRAQLKLTMAALMLSLGSLFIAAFYIIMLSKKIEMTYIWHLKAVIPIASSILCWLSYRAIQKDEEKVRSLDRIR